MHHLLKNVGNDIIDVPPSIIERIRQGLNTASDHPTTMFRLDLVGVYLQIDVAMDEQCH